MKQSRILRRILLAVLLAFLALGTLCPSLGASAGDAMIIDDSLFNDYDTDHTTFYYWHEGVPPISTVINGRRSSMIGHKFPVIMTWGDAYYVAFDDEVEKNISNNFYFRKKEIIFLDWSDDDDDSGYINGHFGADGQYPMGGWYQNLGYNSKLISKLDILNYDNLKNYGTTVTIQEIPGLPNLIPLKEGADSGSNPEDYPRYAIEVDWDEDSDFFRAGENYISGIAFFDYRVTTGGPFGADWDLTQNRNFRWTLMPINSYTNSMLESNGRLRGIMNPSAFEAGNYTDSVYWNVIPANNGSTYRFYTRGTNYKIGGSRISGSFFDYKELKHLVLECDASIALGNIYMNLINQMKIGRFGSYGLMWNRLGDITNTRDSKTKFDFKCYYGEPNLTSIIMSDYKVQNGQVSTLDGPIIIPNQTVITVQSGGTLSINGWVCNNGTIKVEEGGTLYIQDNSCVNRIYDGKHEGGKIVSNGLVIVGENGKLCGGGVEGLQLLDGCHVVNYGAVISENMIISNPYTIENRGNNAYVFYGKGNGVKGPGYMLSVGEVTSSGYPERGGLEPVVTVDVAENAIYHR